MATILTAELDHRVATEINSGRFSDALSVIDAALTLLSMTPRNSDEFERMVREGDESAARGEIYSVQDIRDLFAEERARAA